MANCPLQPRRETARRLAGSHREQARPRSSRQCAIAQPSNELVGSFIPDMRACCSLSARPGNAVAATLWCGLPNDGTGTATRPTAFGKGLLRTKDTNSDHCRGRLPHRRHAWCTCRLHGQPGFQVGLVLGPPHCPGNHSPA